MISVSTSDAARFWAKVNKNGPIPAHRPELGPCWIWTHGCFKTGYAAFYIAGKMVRAGRFAYEWQIGTLGKDLACHACDNRICVNWFHMFPGTHRDNMQDAVTKERIATGDRNGSRTRPDRHVSRLHPEAIQRGERHSMAKLTENDVRAIRRMYADKAKQRELATLFGVTIATISLIVTRKHWRNVE